MATTFDPWLRACLAAGQGGPEFLWPHTRGTADSWTLQLEGDWTGATMAGRLRISPDAAGDPVASFAVAPPAVVSIDGETFTNFAFSLSAGTTFPADNNGDALVELALTTWLTPAGGAETFFAGGVFELKEA